MRGTSVSVSDKFIAGFTYFTMGTVGLVWLVINALRKRELSRFLSYHIFQSIFISFLFFILTKLCEGLVWILEFIPFINRLTRQIVFLLNRPAFGIYSLIQTLLFGLILYLIITSAMGKYSRIPFISDIIRSSVER